MARGSAKPMRRKWPLLVTAENAGQHFFSQPAIQQANVLFIIHMLQIVVQDRHVAQPFFVRRGQRRPCAGLFRQDR